MAGNKKKKKPAPNPARGVATTSIQSKSKVEDLKNADSSEASSAVTPETASTTGIVSEAVTPADAQRELHELSPAELESQLEHSELQQFVEKHAKAVRKESARQVSRLQTDKRLLRGQAEFLSIKDWLPEELIQQIFDFSLDDATQESHSGSKNNLPIGDDLIVKVWNLRLILLGLDISLHRANEAIAFILQRPPSADSTGPAWGLMDSLDWLAIKCNSGELLEYDVEKQSTKIQLDRDSNEVSSDPDEDNTKRNPNKKDSPLSNIDKDSEPSMTDDGIHVSEIESDLEPDELLSVYLRTKLKLYEINPDIEEKGVKKGAKSMRSRSELPQTSRSSEWKLQQKLHKIESDVLFDQREADGIWAAKKIELARDSAQRRKFQLQNKIDQETSTESEKFSQPDSRGREILAEAEELGQKALKESEDVKDDELLGGMFDSLPGVADSVAEQTATGEPQNVTVRDFGRVTGMTPRRVLEEACRSRDSRCKIVYRQVSPTTYSCRHSVAVEWTKIQDVPESCIPFVHVKYKPNQVIITMIQEATPEVVQSESYVATAALFLIFSGSPKEEKAHLKLPPAYRDLWTEFSKIKHDQIDTADRQTVKELRDLVETQKMQDDDEDDEVVFNASSRRLNGIASGIATPASRPQTPKLGTSETSQAMKDIWARKISSSSYHQMLDARMALPMFDYKTTALETIERSQITIIVADTGAGKSTQMPQFLLEHELSKGRHCKIYCTEPRRISAISLAQRVSEELGENRGGVGTPRSLVGYSIRLESHIASQTRLIFATVGIVLRMLENADGLNEITHLILDEVHERSIDTDFLLIVLKSLVQQRPDLKVILMSATVDAQKFSQYLDGAPVISVPGRTFPVQPRFLEDAIELTGHTNDEVTSRVDEEDESDEHDQGSDRKQLQGYSSQTRTTLATYDEYRVDDVLIVKLLEQIAYNPEYQKFSRAILVFLPGIAEIRRLNDLLGGHPSFSRGWRVHALHSTFSSGEQQAAFEIPPDGTRKIVIATNIAETGITIPDITCVIDTGKHREMRFDERRQMSRLQQSFIARANAKQRRGRAGRVQEGICFHLFTKDRFENSMMEQQTPEMLRLSLQDLVMRVKICKLGDIEHALSQALDPPSSKNIRRAIDALIDVGALSENEQLTPLGNQLAKLPLDAQLGKLILYGATFGCLDFTLTVAAALSSKSPFLSPMNAKKQADSVRLGFKRGDSDLLTVYNAYSAWRKVCSTQGISEFHFCNKNFLSPQNLANIEDLKAQLLTSLAEAGFVNLDPNERANLNKVKPGSRQRNFVTLPDKYCKADDNDHVASSVVAWSFYPKIIKREGKGWRNIANNQSLGLHLTSVNKVTLPPNVNYLSFYSIMQSSSKFTNAQETTGVSDFALVLLAGDAVFHMYAGVIVIDGNRLRFKVRDWKAMIVLKILRTKLREVMSRLLKSPGRDLGDRQRRWMELVEKVFEQRKA